MERVASDQGLDVHTMDAEAVLALWESVRG
jgi:hypothetical protein